MTKPLNIDFDEHYFVLFDSKNKSEKQLQVLIEESIQQGAIGITLLLGDEYLSDISGFDTYLKTLEIPISGGIFPEVVYTDNYYTDAAIIIAWKSEIKVSTFHDISNENSELYQQATEKEEQVTGENNACLIFIDGKSSSTESALDALYYRSENDYQYAGAGASATHEYEGQFPCIISNDGILKDALQTVRLSLSQENKVSYGWSILSGPHLVTSSDKTIVYSLDYQSIEDHYRKNIQNNCKDDISSLTIEELLSKHPFGIHRYDEDLIVRAPFKFEDNGLHFFGDIPELSNIYILTGEPDQLLDGVETSFKTFSQGANALSLLISCIGRRTYLGGPKSNEELTAISSHFSKKHPLIGATSFGEIASNDAGLLKFHCLSLVVTSVYK